MTKAHMPEADTAQPAKLVDSGASPDMRSIQLKALEGKLRTLKRQITFMQTALHERNVSLDAMHYVWCDGGCKSGTHRWSPQNITEEVVTEAERNTKRLRHWYNNYLHRNEMGWNGSPLPNVDTNTP